MIFPNYVYRFQNVFCSPLFPIARRAARVAEVEAVAVLIIVHAAGRRIVVGVVTGSAVVVAEAENVHRRIVVQVDQEIESRGIDTVHDHEINVADREIVKIEKDRGITEVAAKIGE